MMQVAWLVVCVLAVVWWGVPVDGSTRPCASVSNGCSVGIGAFLVTCEVYFKPACDRLDACYHCGTYWGVSRLQCDKAFRDDMQKMCEENASSCNSRRRREMTISPASSLTHLLTTPLKRQKWRRGGNCFAEVHTFFNGVRNYGHGYYNWNSRPFECAELRHCLPNV